MNHFGKNILGMQAFYQDAYICKTPLGVGDTQFERYDADTRNLAFKNALFNSGQAFISPLSNWTIAVFNEIDLIAQYMMGEFMVDCEDDEKKFEFLEVWPEFIKGWFLDKVYVAYSEELLETEKRLWKKIHRGLKNDVMRPECKFRLYFSQNQVSKDGLNLYKSALSGIAGIKINEDNTPLVAFSANNGLNFLNLIDIVGEIIAGRKQFTNSFKASSKRVIATQRNQDHFRHEIEQLENPSVLYIKQKLLLKGGENNTYAPCEFMPVDAPMQMLNTLFAYTEYLLSRLGISGNAMNNKTERLTAAENYQNLKPVANVQQHFLNRLEMGVHKMKKLGWVEDNFKIVLTNQTVAQGLPESMSQQPGAELQQAQEGNNKENG